MGVLAARLRDHRRRRVTLALVPAAVLGVLFWRQPVSDPVTLPSFVLDRLLGVAVALALPATVAVLLAPKAVAERLGLAAATVGVALGGSVLVAGTRPPRDLPMLGLALVALATSLGVAGYLARALGLGAGVGLRGVTLTALAALVVTALQFWHTTSFSALQERARLQVTTDLQEQAPRRGAAMHRVRVGMAAENQGAMRALVLGADVRICWWRPDQTVDYSVKRTRAAPNCSTWSPLAFPSWMDPGAPVSLSTVLGVPASSPRIVVTARISYARGDRLALVRGSGREHGTVGGCPSLYTYRIAEEARFRALAQPDRLLGYHDAPGGGRNWLFSTTAEEPCRVATAPLAEYFGVTETTVVDEHWLGSGKAGTAGPD